MELRGHLLEDPATGPVGGDAESQDRQGSRCPDGYTHDLALYGRVAERSGENGGQGERHRVRIDSRGEVGYTAKDGLPVGESRKDLRSIESVAGFDTRTFIVLDTVGKVLLCLSMSVW